MISLLVGVPQRPRSWMYQEHRTHSGYLAGPPSPALLESMG